MATEQVAPAVNGNYASQHHQSHDSSGQYLASYSTGEGASGGNGALDSFGSQHNSQATPGSSTSGVDAEPSKDEVGWSFVKQYYRSLHDYPGKLHLFYNKKSQFVSGVEAEKVNISVGRSAIAERIKELDFHECKVLLTNVDIQSSDTNIVLQVIGAMSNKGAPRNKFVQTFILARQSIGFYVLNDMLRFIQDEGDDEDVIEGTTDIEDTVKHVVHEDKTVESLKKTLTSSSNLQQQREDIAEVDRKLEEKSSTAPKIAMTTSTKTNGTGAQTESDSASTEEVSATASSSQEADIKPEDATAALDAEETASEKPKDPEPTPAVSPPATTAASEKAAPSSAPAKPSGPKTWANLVASAQSKTPIPAAPVAVVTPQAGQAQVRAIPAQSQPTESPESTPQTPSSGNSGWQTAGNDHGKRHSRPQSMSGEKANVLAYVKYVNEKVDADELKQALAQYGDLAYFDVSRQKNCAFVEFMTPTGYNAAVAANPHIVSGESIIVEERRPRSNAYGGSGYIPNRGGTNARGRGNFDGRPNGQNGRGGFQRDGGRGGNYGGNRGRTGNVTPRGRGGSQAV